MTYMCKRVYKNNSPFDGKEIKISAKNHDLAKIDYINKTDNTTTLFEVRCATVKSIENSSKFKITSYFANLRNDPDHHLGLGDIRLTYAQQEEIIKLL